MLKIFLLCAMFVFVYGASRYDHDNTELQSGTSSVANEQTEEFTTDETLETSPSLWKRWYYNHYRPRYYKVYRYYKPNYAYGWVGFNKGFYW